MTELAVPAPRVASGAVPSLFAGAVFMSAALVFLVEPMLGKLILPLLGGSPAVWNTSLAFFQAALLVGYAYAHGLQRLVPSVRMQAAIHVAVLAAAALTLPLRLSGLMGDPPTAGAPALWLLGLLTLTVGAPFAALSATAPLMQAWFARTRSENPYALYAASNLGSLIALVAYPTLVEPLTTLSAQRTLWTGGYALFVAVAAGLALVVARAAVVGPAQASVAAATGRTTWRDRLTWVALAAAPSSLMLGTTTHITTDVASAPFLWVVPLTLYLLTFVVAFQDKPSIAPSRALLWQAAAMGCCVILLPFRTGSWPMLLSAHLICFFLTALICHQALAARRPEPARLTEFYLLLSLGGVIGGAFNAFLAPAIFSQVWEYPLALVLAGLARPWGRGAPRPIEWGLVAAGLAGAALTVTFGNAPAPGPAVALAGLALALGAAFLLRDRAPLFTLMVGAALAAGALAAGRVDTVDVRRSFFGVHRVVDQRLPNGEPLRMLFHGTTLHGAQSLAPDKACRPVTYYAPPTPIAQAFGKVLSRPAPARIGVVGLGAGAVAAFTRPGDRLRFFEIDPAVLAIARDTGAFSYVGRCAKGAIDYRLGDARLTVAREPNGAYDLLMLDAFSSDGVPTHLLTVEAIRLYLDKLAPGGVLVLHLTNRNLDLIGPAAAVARDAGAASLQQLFVPTPAMGAPPRIAPSAVMVLARKPEDLARFAADPRWTRTDPGGRRAWTDDYTNVAGALVAHLRAAR